MVDFADSLVGPGATVALIEEMAIAFGDAWRRALVELAKQLSEAKR